MAKPRKRIAKAVKRICERHGVKDNIALRHDLENMILSRVKAAVGRERRLQREVYRR